MNNKTRNSTETHFFDDFFQEIKGIWICPTITKYISITLKNITKSDGGV